LADFHLLSPIDLNDVKKSFVTMIEGVEYAGDLVLPKPPPPAL